MKILSTLLLVFISISCKQTERVVKQMGVNNFTLGLVSQDTFQLDSISRPRGEVHYLEANGSEYLILNDDHGFNSIEIYNFRTHRLFKRISLKEEGSNGLGSIPSGLFVNNFDSIFLFFNRGQRLSLINSDGRLVDEFGTLRSSGEDKGIPYIEVTARQPIVKKGNSLFFCTYEMEGQNEVAGAILKMDSREVLFPYQLPDIYSEGWWGGVIYDRYYHDYNFEKKLLVQSFGNDHNVYVIDSLGRRKAYEARSAYLPSSIEPYKKRRGEFMKEEQYLYRHAAIQGGYETIKYDPWQRVYYRFVIRPVPRAEYHTPSQTWSDMYVMILDGDFRVIGEFEIPQNYSWHQSVVTKWGLSFYDKEAYNESENIMVFGNFKLMNR